MRIEIDSLGKREMPSGCLYGIRTARCVDNTAVGSASLSAYPELIRALATVKRACASTNVQSGFLKEEFGRLILGACDEIHLQAGKSPLDQSFFCQFPVDMLHGGGYIGFNININEVLANIANIKAGAALGTYSPIDPKLHVNLHQSTADACATAARLAIAERWDTLKEAFSSLRESLYSLGKRYMEVETVARTCMMDAMPVSFGSTFDAWAVLVTRRSKAVQAAVDELRHVNLGGTVIGSGRGAPDAYKEKIIPALSKAAGREMSRRASLYDAAQNIDDLANVSAQLRITAGGLIKIAKDIRLLASGPNCGFGELKLPAVQEGSSFFPGKVNPVVPETLIQACIQVAGLDCAVQSTLEHGELNLNVFEGVALKNILDSLSLLERAISLFTEKCIASMEVDVDRCRKLLVALESNAWAGSSVSTDK